MNVRQRKGRLKMARLETNGLAEFSLSLEELAELPDSLMDEMLNAEADIIVSAQKEKGRAYGVYRTGVTLSSIKKGKPKITNDGKSIYVTPMGKNADGNRNAEVAFINEFGKKGQAPRPFIRDANESKAEEAVEAASKVYDEWLKSKKL